MVTRKAYEGVAGKANIVTAGKLQFTNFEPLTNGTIIDANPDFYDRAHPAKIDRRIRAHSDSFIIPLTHGHAPVIPKFFNEAKGPCGSPAVSERQACALGVFTSLGHLRPTVQTYTTTMRILLSPPLIKMGISKCLPATSPNLPTLKTPPEYHHMIQ